MEASQASEAGSIPVARSTTARPRAGRLCYARFTPAIYRMRRDNRRKTLPTQAGRPLSRYKTRPARPKWPHLARFPLAGRVLSRFCRQQATQDERSPTQTPNTNKGLKETTPQHNTPSRAVKHFPPQHHTQTHAVKYLPPQHATNNPKSPIFTTQGRTFFHNTHHPHNTHPHQGELSFNHRRQDQANQQSHAIPHRPTPPQPHNPQNSNDQASHHETPMKELHAKLLGRCGQAKAPRKVARNSIG